MKKILSLSLILALSVSCKKEQTDIVKNTKNISVEKFTSINELNTYGKQIDSPKDKMEYYFQLYKLQEVEKLKSNIRLKNLSSEELLKIINITFDFDYNYKNEYGMSKLKKLDSLHSTNKTAFNEMLSEVFYSGFEVSLVDCKGNTENDCGLSLKDERKLNPNLLTFLNFRANVIGSRQHIILLKNNSVKEIKFLLNNKETERINTSIQSQFPEEGVYGLDFNFAHEIIKLDNKTYKVSFIINGDGRNQYEKYHNFGIIQFKMIDLETIVPDSFEFYNYDTKKWMQL